MIKLFAIGDLLNLWGGVESNENSNPLLICLVPLSTSPHLYAIQKPHATCHLISTGKGQRSQVLRAMCQEIRSGTNYQKLIPETKYIFLIMPQGWFVLCDLDNVLSFVFLHVCLWNIMDCTDFLKNLYVEAITSNVTMFRDRAFRKVIN